MHEYGKGGPMGYGMKSSKMSYGKGGGNSSSGYPQGGKNNNPSKSSSTPMVNCDKKAIQR